MAELDTLMIASAAFVGSHLFLSHPLRGLLVRMMGDGGFRLLYSLVAFGTFGWMIHAFLAVPATSPAAVPGDVAWAVGSAAMWFATLLLVGSFIGNPALPAPPGIAAASARRDPIGVLAITRHPMMWSFAIWALVHLLLWQTPENRIFAGALLILALVGSLGQDAKKSRLMGDAWATWKRRTGFVPFAAQMTRRTGWHTAWPGWGTLIVATLMWLLMSWAHSPLGARVAAGVWRWL